jgi:hypothetical protein
MELGIGLNLTRTMIGTIDVESAVVSDMATGVLAVEKMVQNMLFLEDVEMWGGLEINEVHLLTQLPKLKRLQWHPSYYRHLKEMNGAYTRGHSDFVREFIRDRN